MIKFKKYLALRIIFCFTVGVAASTSHAVWDGCVTCVDTVSSCANVKHGECNENGYAATCGLCFHKPDRITRNEACVGGIVLGVVTAGVYPAIAIPLATSNWIIGQGASLLSSCLQASRDQCCPNPHALRFGDIANLGSSATAVANLNQVKILPPRAAPEAQAMDEVAANQAR